jgi:hypothetical protein
MVGALFVVGVICAPLMKIELLFADVPFCTQIKCSHCPTGRAENEHQPFPAVPKNVTDGLIKIS